MAAAHNPFDGLQVRAPSSYSAPGQGKGPSPKQRTLISKLIAEKDLSEFPELTDLAVGQRDEFLDTLTGGWEGTASKLIDRLFKAGYAKVFGEDAETDLPEAGFYAVDGKRYKIDRPDTGKWDGWLFFKTGSDYHDQQRLGTVPPGASYRGKAEFSFRSIQADPHAAQVEYARITGNCYVCNRKLEDTTSVALGIGPVCRTKV